MLLIGLSSAMMVNGDELAFAGDAVTGELVITLSPLGSVTVQSWGRANSNDFDVFVTEEEGSLSELIIPDIF